MGAGSLHIGGCHALMCDGAVRWLNEQGSSAVALRTEFEGEQDEGLATGESEPARSLDEQA